MLERTIIRFGKVRRSGKKELALRGTRGLLLASVVVGALTVGVASSSAAKPMTTSVLEVDTFYAGTGGFNLASSTVPPAPGQGITFSGIVYKWLGTKRGAPLGHVEGICTATSGANAMCSGAISLPAGSISLFGPASLDFSHASGSSEVPIVGGTGAYVGARGYMRSTNIGAQNGPTSAAADVIHITS